ncbi:MAG TPA: cell wall metabolism sensor histidine kinase WalK [Clostridia bacterium]|nr:cell wall metabolism sensor histidine kinase WalK [Clostridia bacterium]
MLSVRGKLTLVYVLLILLAIQFVGFFLLQSLEEYYLAGFIKTLTSQGRVLAGLLERYPLSEAREGSNAHSNPTVYSRALALKGEPPPGVSGEVEQLLQAFGRQSGFHIGVFDASGALIATSDINPTEFERMTIGTAITRALSGNEAKEQRINPSTGERLFHFALPVTGRSGMSDEEEDATHVAGLVYVIGSLEEIYSVLGDVRSILFSATVISLVIALILGLGVARAITRPIQELTAKAALMANGNFDQVIMVKENDEIGRLGGMFNYLTTRLRETLKEISSEKARLEAVLVHMTDGIVAVDPSGAIILMNNMARRMLNVPERSEITVSEHVNLVDLVHDPDAKKAIGSYISKIREEERGLGVVDIRVPAKEGSERDRRVLRAYLAPVGTRESGRSGAVVVLHDISEEEHLESLRKEFVANVSHELRTPLAAIKSYVETLIDGALEDETVSRQFLEVVNQETDRMVRLVNNLLDLSRLEYEAPNWEKRPVNLNDIVHSSVQKIYPAAAAKQQTLEFSSLPPDARATVLVDRDRIEQVLLNLLSNAINYTPDGGRIVIRTHQCEGEVITEVEDTGIGIPEEDIPRIFERFYRVDKARSRQLGGTGLGLAIAKEIVEAHGGRIWIESAEGKGTKVSFTLPEVEPNFE